MTFTSKRKYDFSVLGYVAICVIAVIYLALLHFFFPLAADLFLARFPLENRFARRFAMFVFFIPFVLIFTPFKRKTITLQDDRIIHQKDEILYSDVKLEYSANPFVVSGGALLVSSKTEKHISFAIGSRYQKCHIIWEEMLNRVQKANSDADIDPLIKQKLYR
jgi:hypothetical protein